MNKMTLTSKITKNKLPAIQSATVDDLAAALYLEAELIMTDSKTNYVPVITGNLKGSGTVLQPERNGNKVSVTLGYGGSAAPYAAVVHEYPNSYGQHKNKYLQKPINAASHNLASRLAEHIKARLGRR